MMDIWPQLLRPFWLLVLPLSAWLLWRLWHRRRQAGRWQRILPEAFHAALLTRGRQRNSRLPWLVLGLAWLLAFLALLGPSWQQLEQPSLKRADPVVILLQLTPAMLATDVQPNRLEHAKRKLTDLLQTRGDAQTAVVVYAGSAHTLVPLSNDLNTTRNLLEALQPNLMPEPGNRADLAVAQGLTLLEQGGLGSGRLLLITSSLSASEREGIVSLLGNAGERMLVLGVGTEHGGPIATADGSFLKDELGGILIPRLDNSGLRQFANELGGRYQRSRLGNADLENLGLLEPTGELLRQDEITRLSAWLDQGYWLLLPLLLLAACAGRRGWLFCLPLFLVLPQPASAFEWDDLWLRPDQQGQRLLEAQRPADAAERFQNPRWQGFAHYLAGDYETAAKRFAQGESASDHYNRGNALAHSGALEMAVEAYSQALALQPDLEPARHNRELVEKLLQQQRDQEEQQQEVEEPDQPPGSQQSGQPAPADPSAPSAEQQLAQEHSAIASEPSDEQSSPEPDQQHEESASTAAPNPELKQATDQWLRRVPDDPGELLKRKFLYEQRKRQEMSQ